jgi:ribosomal protein S12 methylthiotransferase accessory factor
MHPTENASSRRHLDALRAHPALHACGRFDLTNHLANARTVVWPSQNDSAPTDLDEQLRVLTARLIAAGHTPHYRSVATLPGGITTVHTYAPGMERFMLITDGMLVLPGSRIQRALTHRPGPGTRTTTQPQ